MTTDVADSGAGPARVASDLDPSGVLPWTALEEIRVTGHDGLHARVYCFRCPLARSTYSVSGSLTGIITWATQHYQLRHT